MHRLMKSPGKRRSGKQLSRSLFFFSSRRRHTRSTRDWSSDVCSSDLRASVYLAAVCAQGETVGAAFLDISTGEFRATQANGPDAWQRIAGDIESYAPRELLFPAALMPLVKAGFSSAQRTEPLPLTGSLSPWERAGVRERSLATKEEEEKNISGFVTAGPHPNPLPRGEGTGPQFASPDSGGLAATLTPLDDWLWQNQDWESLLIKQFGVRSLDGYGLTVKAEAI